MEIPRTSIVRATWRALLTPRRLVPMLIVSVPLLMAQARWSHDPLAVPLAIAMVLAFITVAPVSYRVLFPDGLDFSHGAVRVVLYALVGFGTILSLGAGVPKMLGMGYTFLTERTSLAVSAALFLVGGWGLGRDIGFEQRLDRLQREHERAQLLALKAHLDPHFLFNTLNAIAEWCRIDGETAERAVLSLSALMRVLLEGVTSSRWPLEKELDVCRRLIELYKLRDASRFTLSEVVTAPLTTPVLPMALLTLVENAMKHGPGAGHVGELKLSAQVRDGKLVLEVENAGPFAGRREGGTGLPTLEKQLQLAWGEHARFDIRAVDGNRTRATVEAPLT